MIGNYIIIGLLICGFVQAAEVKVSAGNWQDEGYSFCFSDKGDWETTYVSVKEDDTSVYMNCESSDIEYNSYNAYVYGYIRDLDASFCSSDMYTFQAGNIKKMLNYVYENGGQFAYVNAVLNESSGFSTGVFTGVWSPDSI